MDKIPNDYRVFHKNKIAIQDSDTKEIVLVVSFTKFEDIKDTREYENFEKLTMSLAKLRKGNSGFIKTKQGKDCWKNVCLGVERGDGCRENNGAIHNGPWHSKL